MKNTEEDDWRMALSRDSPVASATPVSKKGRSALEERLKQGRLSILTAVLLELKYGKQCLCWINKITMLSPLMVANQISISLIVVVGDISLALLRCLCRTAVSSNADEARRFKI